MEYRTKQPENLSPPQRFGRWLRLKQYQIEVTFGVYMFTPTEKFIFCEYHLGEYSNGSIAVSISPYSAQSRGCSTTETNMRHQKDHTLIANLLLIGSVVFLLCSLMTIATVLYLPQHVLFILSRAWFYVNGGDSGAAPNVVAGNKNALSLATSSVAKTMAAAATETAESMRREL
ncbi:hypothetical protein GGS26DRAFT_27393 [Hypomontagnella submonticulosa]|nr:hypothetical protein GGS26DRAFT_27393 [Hypomontagnella submonticulosa]